MKKFLIFFFLIVFIHNTEAQVKSPDSDDLFVEDTDAYQSKLKAKRKKILQSDKPVSTNLEMSAPVLDYLSEKGKVKLEEGLVISKGNLQLRADRGVLDVEEQSAKLKGQVFMSWPSGSIEAEQAKIYIDSETGDFANASVLAEESDYQMTAKQVQKLSEFDYFFSEPNLSPCLCRDGSRPWSIACSELKVREEGYGRAKDFKLQVNNTPVFYLPRMIFPVKRERQSGLLIPEFGYSNRDGVKFSIPYFLDVDDSTDLIFKPFTQSRTRTGIAIDYNQVYSKKSKLKSRIYYSDESARDGESRGIVTSNIFDPNIDDHRFAGFIKQQWRTGPESSVPVSWISDIHYVSDDLILREFADEELGRYNSRFATSRSVVRANIDPLLTAELSGEYNQSMLTDDDLIFQRAPEVNLYSQKTLRPFGQNPYGIKLVAANRAQAVNFVRKDGFDGARFDLNPSLKVPYHYKNYLNGEVKASANFTSYDLDEVVDPSNGSTITDESRNVYTLSASIGTELEKVYSMTETSPLVWLTSLGRRNQNKILKRVKHTIEPTVSLLYVPDEDHDNLALFDSLDRIRQRRLVKSGFKSRILGRFEPLRTTADKILELAPEVEDLPSVKPIETFNDPAFGAAADEVLPKPVIDKGEIRELASFAFYNTYDYLEDEKDLNPNRTPWSDLGMNIGLYPSDYFALKFDSNLDFEEQDFSSWGVATHFSDDRGDLVRLRYSYVENSISQVEGNLEIALTDRFKLGYYARFDERDSDFLDNQLALRISSACNCWDFDVGFRERLNPDKQDFIAQLTLKGLGALTQDISLLEDQNKER